MTATLEPYPDYKPSGVEWLGDVPAHWGVRRLKNWLGVNELTLSEDTDPEYTFDYVDIGAVETGRLIRKPERMRFGRSPSRARRVVRLGDTIVSTVRTYLKAVWHAERQHPGTDLIASTGFSVFTPTAHTFPKFVSYLCQSAPFTNRVTAESVGVVYPAISETRLAAFEVCIPPLEEQAAIVRYLDHVDQRVRRYLDGKEKLIGLLKEQRQAVIHRAVTRGLDPNVRIKSSRIKWIGDVPVHWERRRLKTILQSIDRRSITGRETLLSLRRDHGVVVYADHFSRPAQGSSLIGYKQVKVGQLVVNRLQANNGLVFCTDLDGLVSPDYSVFKEKFPLYMYYLSALLRTSHYRSHFLRESTGLGTGSAGFLRLYDDKFLDTIVYLPALDEQVDIVDYLDKMTSDVNITINRIRRQIDLMREYRERLIADVVTGKLDVREAAEQLPEPGEKADEPPPSGETEVHTEDGRRVSDHVVPSSEVAGA